jgi:tetratricopeptide (TPR) repeat protein
VAQDQTAKDIENLNAQVQDLVRQFRIDEALPLAERALEGTRKLRLTKENSGVLLSSLVNLAGIETARGKFDKAEELCSEFLPILRKVLPPSLYEMVAALEAYVRTGALFQNGRVTEARLLAEQTLTKVRVLSLPPGIANPILAPSLELLAQIYFALERFDDAEKLFNEELPVLREAPQEPLSPDAVTVLAASARAHALYQKGKILDALSLAKNTLRDAEAWPPSQGKNLGVAYGLIGLADLYSGLGRYDDADQLYIQALPLIKNLLPNGSPLAAVGITEANVRARECSRRNLVGKRFFAQQQTDS